MEAHPLFGKCEETDSIESLRPRGVLVQQKRCHHRPYSSYNAESNTARAYRDWRTIQVAALIAAGASSLVINGYYNPSKAHHGNAGGFSSSTPSSSILRLIESCLSSFQAQQREQRLPNFIHNPSPRQLVAACLIYGIAMNSYYHLHKGDRYQFWFVVGGAVSAFAIGWACGKDVHGILMDFLPWFLILSLVLSAAFHNVRVRNRSQQVVEVAG